MPDLHGLWRLLLEPVLPILLIDLGLYAPAFLGRTICLRRVVDHRNFLRTRKNPGMGARALSLLRLLIAQALHHHEMMLERRQCLGGEVLQGTGLSVLRVVTEELDRILVRGKLLGDI